MRETLTGFQGGLQIGGRIVTNLRYADDIDIILLATSEAELQELVDRLDRVSHKYSLLINVDKNKVMARDGIACRILIQNKQVEPVVPSIVQYIKNSTKYIKNTVLQPSFKTQFLPRLLLVLSFNSWVNAKPGK